MLLSISWMKGRWLKGAAGVRDRYIVFDVETPNFANDRISAIGITVVQGGAIVDKYFSLVNPETRFDAFNIRLTGITPDMVLDQPTFPMLWREIASMMNNGLLIAHNAPFDMRVLAKCLLDYDITWQPDVQYACTCAMGRSCYPQLDNHKLNTLCDYVGIDLNHHQAGSDSLACANLLRDYIRQGVEIERYIRRFNLANCRTEKAARRIQPSESTQ